MMEPIGAAATRVVNSLSQAEAETVFPENERSDAVKHAADDVKRCIRNELNARQTAYLLRQRAIKGSLADIATFITAAEQHDQTIILLAKGERHVRRLGK